MVVKMMKWRPWPELSSKKFEAKITVNCVKGLNFCQDFKRLVVEIKWKGSKGNPLTLSSLKRKSVKKNFTKEESLKDDGVVYWNEEFQSLCNFSVSKEIAFHPWEVSFTLFNVTNKRSNHKVPIVAAASLNIADFASEAREKEEIEVVIPLEAYSGGIKSNLSLCLSLNLVELGNAHEASETMPKFFMSAPVSPSPAEVMSTDRNELSALKAGLQKVKLFKGLSTMRRKKACHEEEGSDGRNSVRSEDTDFVYPVDTDSLGDSEDGESEEVKEDMSMRKSFSYETLAYAKYAGGSCYTNMSGSEDEDLFYYSHHQPVAGRVYAEGTAGEGHNQYSQQSSKRKILPWRKRKLSFRSPKTKGEPLLKKHYGEEGGDDIDFDRRQLSSSDESSSGWSKSEEGSTVNRFSVSEFGDDSFAVGSWEQKEIVSRDGQMKLQTEVFFASIDQRNERAAGESACTALVAVIADWFHSNPEEMPIKSQLDSLIRDGSLEWRNLCKNETYRERFPDKHFDLETVVLAKVRPLSVVPERSFIGFFHPEGIEDEGFDFLKDAMSFDNIWDEISKSVQDSPSHGECFVYIVSWNDHFFILKVERDAYYIIDTLGERLYEGCNQAFILKFDRDTTILQLPNTSQQSDDKPASTKKEQTDIKQATNEGKLVINDTNEKMEESTVACRDKVPENEEESSKNSEKMAFLRSIVTAKTAAIAAAIPAAAFAVSSISSSSHFERPSKNLKFGSISSSNPISQLSFAKNLQKPSPPSALHMDVPSSNQQTSSENGVVLPELLTEFMVDMSCQGCVNAVKSKLHTVEGVKNVDVDLDNQVVRILGSSPVKTMTEALEQTGRKARLIGQGVPDDFLISAAVAEFKGPAIFGVVRLAQVNMELTRIEANFSGLSPGKHAWSINEFGDLTRGAASTGKLYSPPLGDLGTLEVDEKGEGFYSGAKEKLRVSDLIGRAIAVYATEDKSDPGLTAAVIARSAGVGENYKKLCTCDGTTIWEASNKL